MAQDAPGDVSCDLCPDPAECSCLQCQASFCERHLQPHRGAETFQTHQLVAPSHKQDYICPEHDEVKKLFCRSDGQLVCAVCCVERHGGHDTLPLAPSVRQRNADLLKLQRETEDITRSAQTAIQQSGHSFTEMARLLERKRSDMEQQIRSQQETELSRVQELCDQLQRYPSLTGGAPQWTEPVCVHTGPRRYFEDVTRAVTALGDTLRRAVDEGMGHVSRAKADVLLSPAEYRHEFVQHAQLITMDPDTANVRLVLSNGNTRAEKTGMNYVYPHTPERFVGCIQVLSAEPLMERSYWEVEYSGRGFGIGVSYKEGIIRQGTVPAIMFGYNDKSWALCKSQNEYSFFFNGERSEVSGPVWSRIGVYQDHSAGVLSFYSVQDQNMVLLHRVHTRFTQPLYVGVTFDLDGDSVQFFKPE